MGSKKRIAKYLLPFITKHLSADRYYIEPFCGGCNMIDNIMHPYRIASDNNKYLIALFRALQQGVTFPSYITREEYVEIHKNMDTYPDWLVGYVGFVCSFRGILFGSYADNNNKRLNGRIEHRQKEQILNFLSQRKALKNVRFIHSSYDNLACITPP